MVRDLLVDSERVGHEQGRALLNFMPLFDGPARRYSCCLLSCVVSAFKKNAPRMWRCSNYGRGPCSGRVHPHDCLHKCRVVCYTRTYTHIHMHLVRDKHVNIVAHRNVAQWQNCCFFCIVVHHVFIILHHPNSRSEHMFLSPHARVECYANKNH